MCQERPAHFKAESAHDRTEWRDLLGRNCVTCHYVSIEKMHIEPMMMMRSVESFTAEYFGQKYLAILHTV